jgi:hypothetical protein
MDTLDEKLDIMKEHLSEIQSQAEIVTNSQTGSVTRNFEKLVRTAETLDADSKKAGIEYTQKLNIDLELIPEEHADSRNEFFFKNELWNHPDFSSAVTPEQKERLELLRRMPLAHELDTAYTPSEMTDMANYAINYCQKTKSRLQSVVN